jgi:multimeric flavodoxin WrbA
VGVVKVCGIVGSPVKDGNVDLLVSRVLSGASSQGTDVHKLYLNHMNIKPCQSCGVDPYPKYCQFDDDMSLVHTALESCDAIVLGSPVYFDTVSAQTKLMIDRCNCLMPYVERPDGTFGFERRIERPKKGVFIAVAGTGQEFRPILATANGFFHWVNGKVAEMILYAHDSSDIGSARGDKQQMDQAFGIGVEIVQECAK